MVQQSSTVTRWDHRPEYVEACRKTSRQGDPTTYVVPRKANEQDPNDVTDFQVGQAGWSVENPPDIMYTLLPSREWEAFRQRKPRPLKDTNGNILYERWPRGGSEARPLMDLAILPDRIGTQEEDWWMEAVRRLDPRIKWADILMRMQPDDLGRTIHPNALNTQQMRLRNRWCMLSWPAPRSTEYETKSRRLVLQRLTHWHEQNNTTRGLTPGLINPNQGEAGGRVPLPDVVHIGRRLKAPKRRVPRIRKRKVMELGEDGEDEEGHQGENDEIHPGNGDFDREAATQGHQDTYGLRQETNGQAQAQATAGARRVPIARMLPFQDSAAIQAHQQPPPQVSGVSTRPDYLDTPEGRARTQAVRARRVEEGRARRPATKSASKHDKRSGANPSDPASTREGKPPLPKRDRRLKQGRAAQGLVSPSTAFAGTSVPRAYDVPPGQDEVFQQVASPLLVASVEETLMLGSTPNESMLRPITGIAQASSSSRRPALQIGEGTMWSTPFSDEPRQDFLDLPREFHGFDNTDSGLNLLVASREAHQVAVLGGSPSSQPQILSQPRGSLYASRTTPPRTDKSSYARMPEMSPAHRQQTPMRTLPGERARQENPAGHSLFPIGLGPHTGFPRISRSQFFGWGNNVEESGERTKSTAADVASRAVRDNDDSFPLGAHGARREPADTPTVVAERRRQAQSHWINPRQETAQGEIRVMQEVRHTRQVSEDAATPWPGLDQPELWGSSDAEAEDDAE